MPGNPVRILTQVLVVCATLSASHAEETCSLNTILNGRPLSSLPRIDKLPSADTDSKPEHVSLYCAQHAMVSDAFGYWAVIDRKNGIVWLNQYGGYAGVQQWYGPIPVAAKTIDWCLSHRSACPPRTGLGGAAKAQ